MQVILNKLNEILEYVRDTNPSKYIGIHEVSQLAGCSKSTIRRNVKNKSLKCSHRLGKLLFKTSDVEAWLRD